MRVVTRALSMASIVSGRPGPVPGAGESCGDVGCPDKLISTIPKQMHPTILLKRRFTQPPVHSPLETATSRNGHCRILRVQIRNASAPSAISAKPHFLAVPVCQKSHAHPNMVSTAGGG